MTFKHVSLLGILAIAAAEGFSVWWMSPEPDPNLPVLEWAPPGGEAWTPLPDAYDEVDQVLKCNGGWIGEAQSGGRPIRISFFRWDEMATVNTLEAFKHFPEECMGTTGMVLKKVHPERTIEKDGHKLIFDVTAFQPQHGLGTTFIFKAIAVSGHEEATLRTGIYGHSYQNLRQHRLAAAKNRFRPPHTRVLMGGVTGVPTEELAWREFRSLVEPHLRWITRAELLGGAPVSPLSLPDKRKEP